MATRSAAKAAEQLRVSQIGDFKKRLGGILELPSGLIVRWRNPGGMRAFLAKGIIPNSLMPMIEEALNGKKQGVEAKDINMAELLQDTEKVAEMMAMYDNIAQMCIVEPKIYAAPTDADVEAHNAAHPEDEVDIYDLRHEDRLYADELPDEDKIYLFQLVSGGVKDLETFRQQQQINVGDLAAVSGVAGYAIDSSGTDAR